MLYQLLSKQIHLSLKRNIDLNSWTDSRACFLSCKATSKNRFDSLSQLGAVCPPLATENIYNRVQIPWNLYLSGSTEMLVHYAMFSINMFK